MPANRPRIRTAHARPLRKGAATVEFALVVPVLVGIVIGARMSLSS